MEFLNSHIVEQSFTFLTDSHQNVITYWKANGQIKLRLRWNSWILILLHRVFLFLRWTSKYYTLLKSISTNKTQVALEFLNSHIVEQSLTFLTDRQQNVITYWKANGQIKLRLRWNSWIFILYRIFFFYDWHQNIIPYWKASGHIKLRLCWNSWIQILLCRVFLFLRRTSKCYNLLKSKWTNRTQVVLEFLNFHIIVQGFSFFTTVIKMLKTYWKANG